MRSHSRYLLAAAAALVGCVSHAQLEPPDAGHPASPDAPEAAVPEVGSMLREPQPDREVERPADAPHSVHHTHGGADARDGQKDGSR